MDWMSTWLSKIQVHEHVQEVIQKGRCRRKARGQWMDEETPEMSVSRQHGMGHLRENHSTKMCAVRFSHSLVTYMLGILVTGVIWTQLPSTHHKQAFASARLAIKTEETQSILWSVEKWRLESVETELLLDVFSAIGWVIVPWDGRFSCLFW